MKKTMTEIILETPTVAKYALNKMNTYKEAIEVANALKEVGYDIVKDIPYVVFRYYLIVAEKEQDIKKRKEIIQAGATIIKKICKENKKGEKEIEIYIRFMPKQNYKKETLEIIKEVYGAEINENQEKKNKDITVEEMIKNIISNKEVKEYENYFNSLLENEEKMSEFLKNGNTQLRLRMIIKLGKEKANKYKAYLGNITGWMILKETSNYFPYTANSIDEFKEQLKKDIMKWDKNEHNNIHMVMTINNSIKEEQFEYHKLELTKEEKEKQEKMYNEFFKPLKEIDVTKTLNFDDFSIESFDYFAKMQKKYELNIAEVLSMKEELRPKLWMFRSIFFRGEEIKKERIVHLILSTLKDINPTKYDQLVSEDKMDKLELMSYVTDESEFVVTTMKEIIKKELQSRELSKEVSMLFVQPSCNLSTDSYGAEWEIDGRKIKVGSVNKVIKELRRDMTNLESLLGKCTLEHLEDLRKNDYIEEFSQYQKGILEEKEIIILLSLNHPKEIENILLLEGEEVKCNVHEFVEKMEEEEIKKILENIY